MGSRVSSKEVVELELESRHSDIEHLLLSRMLDSLHLEEGTTLLFYYFTVIIEKVPEFMN